MAIFKDRGAHADFAPLLRKALSPFEKERSGVLGHFAAIRNMGTMTDKDTPEALAARMRLSVESHRNERHRSQKPAHHFLIAFSAEDFPKLTPAILREYAEQHLQILGLAEHMAVIVQRVHGERHCLHIVVSKVHPFSGKLWNSSHASRKVQSLLASLDEAHGMTAPQRRAYSYAGGAADE